ncbi:MAG: phosphatidylglycerophosphatase A [Paracoccaceae bacterium]
MIARAIATLGGVGYLRPAPGTWGSAVALPLAYLLHIFGGPWALVAGIVAASALGWWATWVETRGRENHDPSEIVIDELAGQWIALLPVSFGAAYAGADVLALYPGWIAAFVLFRLFDITKLWIIGWADARDDALGVMLDDIFAGAFAALGVAALAALAHLAFV